MLTLYQQIALTVLLISVTVIFSAILNLNRFPRSAEVAVKVAGTIASLSLLASFLLVIWGNTSC